MGAAGVLTPPADEGGEEPGIRKEVGKAAGKPGTIHPETPTRVDSRSGTVRVHLPEVREALEQEPRGLRDQVAEAGSKLNPLKESRQEFEQPAAARRSIDDITGQITHVETEVGNSLHNGFSSS